MIKFYFNGVKLFVHGHKYMDKQNKWRTNFYLAVALTFNTLILNIIKNNIML